MTKRVTLTSLSKQLAAHDAWEKSYVFDSDEAPSGEERVTLTSVVDRMDKRTAVVEGHIIVLNKEMGEVQGQLVWIKILMAGTLATALANLGWMVFGK